MNSPKRTADGRFVPRACGLEFLLFGALLALWRWLRGGR